MVIRDTVGRQTRDSLSLITIVLQTVLLGGLFIWVHWNVLWRLAWMGQHSAWGHLYLVPLVAVYMIYHKRQALAQTTPRLYPWAWGLWAVGELAYLLAIYPLESVMLQGYAMILALAGLVLFVTGPQTARLLLPAVGYLVFAVRIDAFLWENIAWRLQMFAAQAAAILLTILGWPLGLLADIQGAQITLSWWSADQLHQGTLNVHEACSGLKYLMAFMALGTAYAYCSSKPRWIRILLVLATLPVALTVNILRVTIQGLIFPWYPQLVGGDFHLLIGLLMLIPALAMFAALAWLLDHLLTDPSPGENGGMS